MRGADIWAVVPIKNGNASKQRLADYVPYPLRANLALAMFEDVVRTLAAAEGLAGILVLTEDPSAASVGRRYGARINAEHARGGHTAVIAAAARLLSAERRGGLLQMPGDIPLVSVAEISKLLAAHRAAPSFTIVPSHDFLGSNAVLVSPPDAVPLTFGPNSFYPHLRMARAFGIEPTIVRLQGVGLDIDHPEDLCAFAQLSSRTLTQAFLARHGLHMPAVAAQTRWYR